MATITLVNALCFKIHLLDFFYCIGVVHCLLLGAFGAF